MESSIQAALTYDEASSPDQCCSNPPLFAVALVDFCLVSSSPAVSDDHLYKLGVLPSEPRLLLLDNGNREGRRWNEREAAN
ncbi:hypothetical protein Dimus_021454 [Dionaea muscipula]